MQSAERNLDRPEQRLLSDLAAFEQMTRDPGPSGLSRLEAQIGAERARFLVRALSGGRRRPGADVVPPAATA